MRKKFLRQILHACSAECCPSVATCWLLEIHVLTDVQTG